MNSTLSESSLQSHIHEYLCAPLTHAIDAQMLPNSSLTARLDKLADYSLIFRISESLNQTITILLHKRLALAQKVLIILCVAYSV